MRIRWTMIALSLATVLCLILCAIVITQSQTRKQALARTYEVAEVLDLLLESTSGCRCRFSGHESGLASVSEVTNPEALSIYPKRSRYFIVTFLPTDAHRRRVLEERFGVSNASETGLDIVTDASGKIISLGWSKP